MSITCLGNVFNFQYKPFTSLITLILCFFSCYVKWVPTIFFPKFSLLTCEAAAAFALISQHSNLLVLMMSSDRLWVGGVNVRVLCVPLCWGGGVWKSMPGCAPLCTPGLNPAWSWCIIQSKCCWIQFIYIVLKIFAWLSEILVCSYLFLS